MIALQTRREAESIGKDSWELANFANLKASASKAEQIAALRDDLAWMQDHLTAVSGRIRRLITKLGG